jgi:hypothetical protein
MCRIYCSKTETFWATTGLFPQEFIVSFSSEMSINSITIHCSNGKQNIVNIFFFNELTMLLWLLLSNFTVVQLSLVIYTTNITSRIAWLLFGKVYYICCEL